ncbi:putative P-loop containing nucleoside triphosphate hydrolase, leucine-rich repeat domain, L [Rosa chinensis]|uniref:Putative P-loop containing nucleoside triphosphate hydrolase, leucine-rich repeat domain, L n=1 Tax=Rosa chinensis TaxID=74649 RepID=A0A2P6SL25_ROSCH|nr:putative disease resistance protein RGA3 isoform X1 [Rosa chinensis]XP_040365805.1 putative disease resistance protein RGA3 isoform X1 [Rosa chinensis]PRQ59384.1 putative P-loop containing nucleoside triphosphate hydrolase, leucine-rich repeat domain, L [Rosa chinensis]
MAEALVNVLLERLATITLDKIRGEFKLVTGVEIEVENLTSNLKAIQAVLKDAEQRQVTEASVRLWLDKLNEVSYEMDNVLDEWITQVRKRQMEKEEKHALAIAEKVRSSASSFFSCSKIKRLNHRGGIAGRIKKLNERLALIDQEKQRFNFQNNTERGPEIPRQETTCFSSDKIFGRENEKSIILSKLLSESSPDWKVPLIIPIVGMGGMGKTTLSQEVYNDQKVKARFDKRVWVCVSDPFDEIKIARAIVEGLNNDNTSKFSNSLQILMQHIQRLIKGQKVLLVLDDVWNPRKTQWEELIKPFCRGDVCCRCQGCRCQAPVGGRCQGAVGGGCCQGAVGCSCCQGAVGCNCQGDVCQGAVGCSCSCHGAVSIKVLVTTRNEEVATLMKATDHVIYMKQLSEELCRSLFYYNAGRDICSESKMFQDVGEKIVKKCDGLPLAAKTLGSLMFEKKTLKDWEDVLNSKLWELEGVEQQVFLPLLLSYYDLTQEIRNCLLYCVIFPKDYVYDRDNLVELWMSQYYLNVEESKEMERLGQKYFNKLVMRSFFQEVVVKKYGETKCKIHDIIHDFMSYMTKKECLILDRGAEVGPKVRHLTLINDLFAFHIDPNSRSCENLRTLVVLGYHGVGRPGEGIVQWKYVRTLTWLESRIRAIPISGLIHLRYLDLSGSSVLEEVELGSLYNLQTLRLVDCHRLKKVELGRLINLRHLSVRGCKDLKLRGIERLTNLQTLDEFYVQAGDEGNKLEHLINLNQLQGRLTITDQGGPGPGAGDAAIMVNKAHLLHLVLDVLFDWRWELTALQPPPGLESLSIHGCILSTDWWSSLHNLRLLTVSWCGFLPSLGNLASLESLYIEQVSVTKVGVEFLGIHDHDQSEPSWRRQTSFPKLKQLTFDDMPNWKEWQGVKEDSEKMAIIMPCLSELTIYRCIWLEALPEFLWKTPLQKLHIRYSPILQNLYKQGKGEQWAKISHIPTIYKC